MSDNDGTGMWRMAAGRQGAGIFREQREQMYGSERCGNGRGEGRRFQPVVPLYVAKINLGLQTNKELMIEDMGST